jgi:hypothetical protein
MGGYALESSGSDGERVSDEDYRLLVDGLTPLLHNKARGMLLSSEEWWGRRSSSKAVVCTDLEETAVHQDHDPWLKMLMGYDKLVAREVSMHAEDCLVVRPVRNGYLVVFNEPRDAAAWAKRLQFEVERQRGVTKRSLTDLPIPTHNIALTYGPVSRILRAHGYDHVGAPIDDCIEFVAKLRNGVVAMSRTFADQYEGRVGGDEFRASTTEVREAKLGRLRLLTWP